MVISVGTGRRSIRDAVLGGGVQRGGGRQLYYRPPLRCGLYDGSVVGGQSVDGLATALSEEAAADPVRVPDGAAKAKNVLILMSDTGGGHRASAEALRDAFRIEFGDAYQVCAATACHPMYIWSLLLATPSALFFFSEL